MVTEARIETQIYPNIVILYFQSYYMDPKIVTNTNRISTDYVVILLVQNIGGCGSCLHCVCVCVQFIFSVSLFSICRLPLSSELFVAYGPTSMSVYPCTRRIWYVRQCHLCWIPHLSYSFFGDMLSFGRFSVPLLDNFYISIYDPFHGYSTFSLILPSHISTEIIDSYGRRIFQQQSRRLISTSISNHMIDFPVPSAIS